MRVFGAIGLFLAASAVSAAAEHRGVVKFGGLPVPGATVTASQGAKRFRTITDPEGVYSFADLGGGKWTIRVEMLSFEPAGGEVAGNAATASEWDLKALPVQAAVRVAAAPKLAPESEQAKAEPAAAPPPPEEVNQAPSDGFLINGSVNNGAASPFAQAAAFGNYRLRRSVYNGSLGMILNNAFWDARPFSLTDSNMPKPDYTRAQGVLAFGGPLRIPRLVVRNGPELMINYQWTRNRNATTGAGRVPTPAQRAGDLAGGPLAIDPSGGSPFPGNVIPQSRIAPQARALLGLYPAPNFDGGSRYNYGVPLAGSTHQDDLQTHVFQRIGRKDSLLGQFSVQSARADTTSLFPFLDTTASTGINTSLNWNRRIAARTFSNVGYEFSRYSGRATPYFAGRENVSRLAGIAGNNQDAANWGPPSLIFSSGIATLADIQSSLTRNQTSGVSASVFRAQGSHNVTAGAGLKRQQFNLLSQQDPRGTLAFTGAAAGNDVAGFLLGIPDTSSIAFGNADKYLRASSYDAFFTDDWRVRSSLTINAGLRWDYTSPIAERYGRLVNLAAGSGFASVSPEPGATSGRPYMRAVQPRVGLSWRPLPASSIVVRAGYGVYYDSSIYLPIATRMAQQAPLSTSLSIENSVSTPLTLAEPFRAAPNGTATFGVAPDFRPGYSQNWQVAVQRDLPASMVVIATYLGIKGTHAQQQFLPNTYPAGAENPCPACPAGFIYLASNGNSTRQSGQIQLRRRLRAGLGAQLSYTFSKAIDDAATGGAGQSAAVIAQDWRNLRGERGPSGFDQRHLLNLEMQYTTGMGLGGGTLLGGWRGRFFKDWTVATRITAASGLPQTPVFLAPVRGTGVTGSIRPDYTGAALYDAPSGLFLNPAAVAAPAAGRWGSAGRNSIRGPAQFALNASLARTFRLGDRLNADFRIDSLNALNKVTFTGWNVIATSPQFGLPAAAKPMRSLQATMRVRF